ncbi:MAG TPA: hypothetical protein VGL89_12120 [Candidatus Koribacter sp.]|jgi:hypothetical protein
MSSFTSIGFGYARALRREIIARNKKFAEERHLASVSGYGKEEVVVYAACETEHGNFFPESYAAIIRDAGWRKRLQKPHTGRRNLPKEARWKELDACTSSDALLMNIFCNPQALAEGKLQRLMGVPVEERPEFGVRVAASIENGHRDRTEVDMRVGDVLVEAKLTESDFQCCRPSSVERYRDFCEVFDRLRLPRIEDGYASYQLLRSVLAAQACGSRFCVVVDGRRPDLREQWFAVMQCVRDYELKMRCQVVTWQEIAAVVPRKLADWLGEKYGIYAPGNEPQMDSSEWYW